ncbi:hypothetical protein RCL1_001225 [Eukaryota sp. TZLM3-RCL]
MLPLRFAVVCASNQNRSMAAHHQLRMKSLDVSSFGTGSMVQLPGPAPDAPNVYSFGTPYQHMINDLKSKDEQLYISNGVLPMLQRNASLKEAPERFQNSSQYFDVIITFEHRVFDKVLEHLFTKDQQAVRLCHVINIDVHDTHLDAIQGGLRAAFLAEALVKLSDLHAEVMSAIKLYEERFSLRVLYSVAFN